MRTLIVVRHAKADTPSAGSDFDRPLRPRGLRDARAAGAWLRETIGPVDVLISSPARRAVETAAELLAAYGDAAPPTRYTQEVYEATAAALLEVVSDVAEDSVVLVGHNPSVSALVGMLTGQAVDLPTCGIAVVDIPAPSTGPEDATLRLVTVSRAG
ncbi:MAG: histidine phosphatase family protein [Frankiaceae bacterium]